MNDILSSRIRHSKKNYYLVKIPSGISNRLKSVCFSYSSNKLNHVKGKKQYKTRKEALVASKKFFKQHYNFEPNYDNDIIFSS